MAMNLDYENITSILRGLFTRLRNGEEKFQGLNFSLDDEQAFLKSEALDASNDLFIVVQYGEASTSLGSCVLSLTFTVLGLQNEITLARDFLSCFALKYNLKEISDGITINVNTPNVSSNFNEAGSGYRSLCIMQGLLIIGVDMANFGKLEYIDDDGTAHTIPILNFQDSATNNLAPQVYGNTYGRTASYAVSQTYTFTISTYSIDNALIRKVNDVKYGNESKENANFKFTLTLSNGQGFTARTFKLSNATYAHSIGNIDGVGLTFTL